MHASHTEAWKPLHLLCCTSRAGSETIALVALAAIPARALPEKLKTQTGSKTALQARPCSIRAAFGTLVVASAQLKCLARLALVGLTCLALVGGAAAGLVEAIAGIALGTLILSEVCKTPAPA